jgi:hypothetical protein
MKLLIVLMLLSLVGCLKDGTNGANGIAGKDGAVGAQGPAGVQGPKGDTGAAGTDGVDGKDGATGPQGMTGAIGLPGKDGAPGTVVTPIQFCPGVTPVYPTTFPEYGLVINGSIFAVYSANGGFLALIPPGVYSSNAIGSACNFTVNEDGTVTND